MKKYFHRNTHNNVWPHVWTWWPSQVDTYINHHRDLVRWEGEWWERGTFGPRQYTSAAKQKYTIKQLLLMQIPRSTLNVSSGSSCPSKFCYNFGALLKAHCLCKSSQAFQSPLDLWGHLLSAHTVVWSFITFSYIACCSCLLGTSL